MAIKIKIPSFIRKQTSAIRARSAKARANAVGWRRYEQEIRFGVAGFILVCLCIFAVFTFYYIKYQRIVDKRMSGQIFAPSAKIYARPVEVDVGDKEPIAEIESELRHAGYSEGSKGGDAPMGHFELGRGAIQIHPGPQSYHSSDSATIFVGTDGKVSRIEGGNGGDLSAYELEPQLVTALFEGEDRSKRELVKFDDIPKVMVDAVLAIEDRRFFQHSGVNYFRLAEAALSTCSKAPGTGRFDADHAALARVLPYAGEDDEAQADGDADRHRAGAEVLASSTSSRCTPTRSDLGQRGSFTINGLGEAARAYFNKDVKNLSLPEAALLAGMIQRPNYLSPYKYPERALDRRNLVLDSMVETGAITREEADRAKATPLKLATPNVEASDAPYFVDLVKDHLNSKFSENEVEQPRSSAFTPRLIRPAEGSGGSGGRPA